MLPNIESRMGRLSEGDTLLYYEGPVLFTCRNDIGQTFLAVAVEEEPHAEVFLYVPISNDRLVSVRTGWITVRAAFQSPETETVFVVRIGYAGFSDSIVELPSAEIPTRWLPDEDLALDDQLETAFHYTPEWLSEMSSRQQRSLTALEFHPPTSLRTEIPLARLGAVMTEFQDLAEVMAIRPHERGESVGDVLREAELAFVQLAAASFVLVVAPFTPNRLIPLPSTAMNNVADILEATRNNELNERVSGLPVRTIGRVRDFLDVVSDLESGVTMVNATPDQAIRTVDVPLPSVRNGLFVLRHRKDLPSTTFESRGHVMAINYLNGTFTVVEDVRPGYKRARVISGKFGSDLLDDIERLEVGPVTPYRFEFLEERDTPEFEGARTRNRYRLLGITPAAQLEIGS